jgi:hypothetical protein
MARREARFPGHTMIFRGRDRPLLVLKEGIGAEGATTRETLRQKDREGDEILESGVIFFSRPPKG